MELQTMPPGQTDAQHRIGWQLGHLVTPVTGAIATFSIFYYDFAHQTETADGSLVISGAWNVAAGTYTFTNIPSWSALENLHQVLANTILFSSENVHPDTWWPATAWNYQVINRQIAADGTLSFTIQDNGHGADSPLIGTYNPATQSLEINGMQWNNWGFFDWWLTNSRNGRVKNFVSTPNGNAIDFTFTLDGVAYTGSMNTATHCISVGGVQYGTMWVFQSQNDRGWAFASPLAIQSQNGQSIASFTINDRGFVYPVIINLNSQETMYQAYGLQGGIGQVFTYHDPFLTYINVVPVSAYYSQTIINQMRADNINFDPRLLVGGFRPTPGRFLPTMSWIWMEIGQQDPYFQHTGSGLEHIWQAHSASNEFGLWISPPTRIELATAILTFLQNGLIVNSIQRPDSHGIGMEYTIELFYNGALHRIVVLIGSNGYVVRCHQTL